VVGPAFLRPILHRPAGDVVGQISIPGCFLLCDFLDATHVHVFLSCLAAPLFPARQNLFRLAACNNLGQLF
jgi:hypothetical protein